MGELTDVLPPPVAVPNFINSTPLAGQPSTGKLKDKANKKLSNRKQIALSCAHYTSMASIVTS